MEQNEAENKKAKVEEYRKMGNEGIVKSLIGTIVGAIVGLIIGIAMYREGDTSIGGVVFYTYIGAGFTLGWAAISTVLNKLFGNMAIWGTAWFWIISFIVKVVIAACIGIFALPVYIVKRIIDYVSINKKADDIIEKMNNDENGAKQ